MTVVLHVMGSLDRGGAETVALGLCEAIPTSAVRQVFVCLSGRRGSLAERFEDAGAQVVPLALSPVATFPVRFSRLLHDVRPDAVVSHVSLSSGFVLWLGKLARVPIRVSRLHSQGDGRADSPVQRARRWMLRRMLVSSATHIAGVSEPASAFGTGGSARVRPVVEIVANGVDTERYDLGERTDGPTLRVLYVGRAAPEKNRVLLSDIGRVLEASGSITVVGPGGSADLGAPPANLHVRGERDDVDVLMRSHDVLVLTSIREGLPGVVLEALASGLPVVASDIPAMRTLAKQVRGVELVSLRAPASAWAEALHEAGTATLDERRRIRSSVLDSPFSMEATKAVWLQIWGRTP